jgi:hypothetical protein
MPKQPTSDDSAPSPSRSARSAATPSNGSGASGASSNGDGPSVIERGQGPNDPSATPIDREPAAKDQAATLFVEIRASRDDPPFLIPIDDELAKAAMDWSRIVRNRVRWTVQAEARASQGHHSRMLLRRLGVDLKVLDELAVHGVLQVSIPFVDEPHGWAARIFPWEYVLSSATRDGCAWPLMVLRQLVRMDALHAHPHREGAVVPKPVLIIESAPGTIRQKFDLHSESILVNANLADLRDTVQVVHDPSPKQVREVVARMQPGLIHLAGVDSHQGAQVLGKKDDKFDGFMLADDRGRPEACVADELDDILAAGDRRARLVSCNFQQSAARVAPLIVAAGAEAAIGFQDVVNATMAELFFTRFYANWADSNWGTVIAFARTLGDLRVKPGVLSGLGIVLWSEIDAIADGSAGEAAALSRTVSVAGAAVSFGVQAAPKASGTTVVAIAATGGSPEAPVAVVAAAGTDAPPSDAVEEALVDKAAPGTRPEETGAASPHDRPNAPRHLVAGEPTKILPSREVWVEAEVHDVVNYVDLHNNGSLFESFRLRKGIDGTVDGVEVEVVLYVGHHSFPYRATLSLTEPVTEIRDSIRIPLTSDLLRSAHENVQSVVYFRVRRDHVILREETKRVILASVDEWMDTDEQTRWLPSFVLPRDPAVDEIRRRALPALRFGDDSRGGGFLGYQAVDKGRDQPYKGVDNQAMAIWSSLSFDYDLSYVNPPPTYVKHAQRLRTPTDVIRTQSGTCIDLALLYAACLEAIGIYPFIVMYVGHANVGYWRSQEFHEAFQTLQPSTGKAAGMVVVDQPPASVVAAPAARRPANLLEAPPASRAPWAHQGGRSGPDVQADPWEIQRHQRDGDPNLNEVRSRLDRQDLVILDATRLTFREGFRDAADRGRDSFDVHEFRSLVDIRIARKSQVTPLPIRSE